MSVDNYKYEIHLTPNGWIDGSSWFYNQLQEKEIVPKPNDTVETWQRHETQSSAYSAPDIKWSRTWQKPGITSEEINELHRKFPRDLRR